MELGGESKQLKGDSFFFFSFVYTWGNSSAGDRESPQVSEGIMRLLSRDYRILQSF